MRPRVEKVRTRPKNFSEARHVRKQLSVYEHEDVDIGVQNISVTNQYTTEMVVDGYIVNIN